MCYALTIITVLIYLFAEFGHFHCSPLSLEWSLNSFMATSCRHVCLKNDISTGTWQVAGLLASSSKMALEFTKAALWTFDYLIFFLLRSSCHHVCTVKRKCNFLKQFKKYFCPPLISGFGLILLLKCYLKKLSIVETFEIGSNPIRRQNFLCLFLHTKRTEKLYFHTRKSPFAHVLQ